MKDEQSKTAGLGLFILPPSSFKRRRPVRSCLVLIAALLLAGCASWSQRRPGDGGIIKPPDTQGEVRQPTEADLVRYLNQKSASLRLIDCGELDIDVKAQGSNLPGLRGEMVCEKPRNFRLQ